MATQALTTDMAVVVMALLLVIHLSLGDLMSILMMVRAALVVMALVLFITVIALYS